MDACYTLPDAASNAISHNLCQACGLCVMTCPTTALRMELQEISAAQIRKSPAFVPDLCVHCGRCAAVCPSGTISEYRNEQLLHRVQAQGIHSVVFFCEKLNSALPSPYEGGAVPLDLPLDEARKKPRLQEGLSLAADCHWENVRCTGRIGSRLLLRLALAGVRAVLVFACPPRHCEYAQGRAGVVEQVAAFTDMLDDYAISTVRVQVIQKQIASPAALAALVEEFLSPPQEKQV